MGGCGLHGDDDLVYHLAPATWRARGDPRAHPRAAARRDHRAHVGHPDVDGPRARSTRSSSAAAASSCARPPGGRAHDRGERAVVLCWLSHFGELLSNNSFGHRMVRVQQEVLPGGVQPARARSRRPSSPCTTNLRPVLAALDPPGRAGWESQFFERHGLRHHRGHPPRRPADPPPRSRTTAAARARPPARRHALRRPDLLRHRRPHRDQLTYSSILPALHVLAAHPRRGRGARGPPACARRAQVELACGPMTPRWRTTTRCATRAPTRRWPDRPAPAGSPGVERGAHAGPAPAVGRGSLLMEARADVSGTTRARSRGAHRGKRLQQRRRGPREPLQGRGGQAQARPTRAPHCLLRPWTDPVAGQMLADHGDLDTRASI